MITPHQSKNNKESNQKMNNRQMWNQIKEGKNSRVSLIYKNWQNMRKKSWMKNLVPFDSI